MFVRKMLAESDPAALPIPVSLAQVSEILDQWIQLQRQWMYLEPIFGSEDIMQQLPLEGKRFATVDRMWRKTTEAAKRNPLVLKVGRAHLMTIASLPSFSATREHDRVPAWHGMA